MPNAVARTRTKPRGRFTSGKRTLVLVLAALSLVASTAVSLGVATAESASADAPVQSLWPSTAVPRTVSDPDTAPVELGVGFTPDVSGRVLGVRFYKGPNNTGTHTGRLWSSGGRLLAKVTFAGETATGWQEARFSSAVTVTAGARYVVSYHTQVGRYSADSDYFASNSVKSGNLTAPASTSTRGNGVYKYGSPGFPTQTYRASNYWVDVVFAPLSPATVSPSPTTTATAAPSPAATAQPTPEPTASPIATASPSVAPNPTAAPTTPPPTQTSDPLAGLPRIPWEGGSAYYRKFAVANGTEWATPEFFPISVFFCKPGHAALLKSLGVNTCMSAEHDGSPLTTITDTGMYVLAHEEWTAAEVGNNPRVVGYVSTDECEMGYSGCTGPGGEDIGEQGRLDKHRQVVSALRSRNDGRFIHANFGNGVLRTHWAPTTMDDHVQLVDSSSVDKYGYTSPHVQWLLPQSPRWPSGAAPASSGTYGWLAQQMASFQDPAVLRPHGTFVETAKPYLTESGATTIGLNQIEGAVWGAIRNEARSISYFQHNNDGCGNYSLVDCSQALKDRVTSVNAKVRSLAPVLNTQSYRHDFRAGVETMLKAHGGSLYVFAGIGLNQAPGTKTFTLPAGVAGTVEVVGENRTLPINGGTFTDTFAAEFSNHVYRVRI